MNQSVATSTKRRRLLVVVAVSLGLTVSTVTVRTLHGYNVPLAQVLLIAAVMGITLVSGALHIADAATMTTHRCTARGCDFRVRLSGADAAEDRRWQEIAVAHPHHR